MEEALIFWVLIIFIPFGIGDHCAASSRNPYFIVTCNNTFQPSRPMVGDITTSVEVLDISLEHGMMRVYNDVSYTLQVILQGSLVNFTVQLVVTFTSQMLFQGRSS